MAAPSYSGNAATGQTDAGGAWTYTGSTAAGAVGAAVVLQILQDGTTNGAVTLTSATNIENLAGTDNAWTQIVGGNADSSFPCGSAESARQFLYIGRRINASAPTASGGNSTSEDLYMLTYQFNDVSPGTTLATVIENSTAGTSVNGAGTSTTVADTGVTTIGPDRLACNFVAVNDDVANNNFAGASGGTWGATTSYSDSSGTDGAIQCQVAPMAAAGTINGGTYTITSAGWGVAGFALIGTTADRSTFAGPTNFQDPGMFAKPWRPTMKWWRRPSGLIIPQPAN